MNQTCYVVVLEDRHCDDTISVHLTRASADNRVSRLMAESLDYYPGMKWEEQQPPSFGAAPWVFHARSDNDDGPKVRIEEREVEP